MPKIFIKGRKKLQHAEEGLEVSCPDGQYWDSFLKKCVEIPQLKQSTGSISSTTTDHSLDAPGIGRGVVPQAMLKAKNAVNSWLGNTGTSAEIRSIVDPTGASNYPFLAKSIDEFTEDPGLLTGVGLGFNILGSVPILSAGTNAQKAVVKRIPWKEANAAGKTAKVIKAPYRAAAAVAKPVLNTVDKVVSAPAKALNKVYKKAGVSTPIMNNAIANYNRGYNAWSASSPYTLQPAVNFVGNVANRVQDQLNNPEFLQRTFNTIGQSFREPRFKDGGIFDEIPSLFTYSPEKNVPGRMQVGGTPPNCNPGYIQDPNDPTKCIPAQPRIGITPNNNLVDTPPEGYTKDYGTMQITPTIDQSGITGGFDWSTGNPDYNTTAAPVNPDAPVLYEMDTNQTGSNTGLFKCPKGYHKDKTTGQCVRNSLSGFQNGMDKFNVSGLIGNEIRQSQWDKKFRKQNFSNYPLQGRSRGSMEETNTGLVYDRYGRRGYQFQNQASGFTELGGPISNNSTMGKKIRIYIKGGAINEMKYGGQSGYGFDLGQRNTYTAMPEGKTETVSNTIKEVPRDQANIEAEKGETVYGDIDGDGFDEHMNIGGKRHVNGGTPLDVPEGSFVFSDTKSMRIKDPVILKKFGITPTKAGVTPAEIAKKYNINKYKAILQDPNSDQLNKNTAQLMIKNFQRKLAELALVQESMKGFPSGIPEFCKKILPEELLESIEQSIAEQNGEQGVPENEEDMMNPGGPEPNGVQEYPEGEEPEEGMMMYGGNMYAYGGDLDDDDEYDISYFQGGGENAIIPHPGDKYENRANASKFSKEQWAEKLREAGYTGPLDNASVQRWLYSQKASKDVIDQLHQQHGMPKKGMFDNILGYRWDSALEALNKIPPADTSVYGYKCTGRSEDNVPLGIDTPITYPNESARTAAGAYATPGEAAKNGCPPNKIGKSAGKIAAGTPPDKIPFDYMTPDVWNIQAVQNRRINKTLPFIADVPYEAGNYTPEEWRTKAAELQSQTNDMARLTGIYGPTTGASANFSNLAGKQARNLTGVISDVDARNVQGLNISNKQEQARKDQFNALRAANATERYKGNAIANQQYDNSINKQIADEAAAKNAAWANRMQLDMINQTNRYYYTDPYQGRFHYKSGYGLEDLGKTSFTGWDEFVKQFPEDQRATLSPKDYIDFLKAMKGQTSTKYGGNIKKKKPTFNNGLADMLSNGYSFPF